MILVADSAEGCGALDVGMGVPPNDGELCSSCEVSEMKVDRSEVLGGESDVSRQSGGGGIGVITVAAKEENMGVVGVGEDADGVADSFGFGRILFVDDDRVSREIGRLMLGKLGFQVDLAVDGRQGLEMATMVSYPLILMDCWMPVMGGIEATRRLRSSVSALSRRAQVLALTASVKPSEAHECRDAGMDDFIVKPLRMEYLIAKLTLHLPNWHPQLDH